MDDPAHAPAPLPTGSAPRPIPLGAALIPLAALVVLLSLVLLVLPRLYPGFEGTGHLPLVGAAVVAAGVAGRYGWSFREAEAGAVEGIRLGLGAILILLTIGMLMGTWLASGVVPALIHWGLSLLAPSYFLAATCAVCSVVSLVSGSSWSTAGTIGLALVGVGQSMGVEPAMTAGAVVSGAYFGDKLSPMSDTTNLAPAMAGTDLFTHIRHMLTTTLPAWTLAMIGYGVLGLNLPEVAPPRAMATLQELIVARYHPGWLHLLPPAVVLGLVLRRVPALPALLAGTAAGGIVAVIDGVSLADLLTAATSGYVAHTGDPALDDLLSRGGLLSMGSTVFLILCALSFGGIMEHTGMLRVIARALLARVRSAGGLVAATIGTSVGLNVVAADQYIAIVVPGRMYARAYREQGLDPRNLSRALEDGGTITSALVPWNTCGAFMSATLMVSTGAYLPYAFLNLLNPLLSLVYGFTGWTMVPLARPDAAPGSAEPEPTSPPPGA